MKISNQNGKVLYVQLSRDETRLALFGGANSPSVTIPTPAGAVGDGIIQNPEVVRTMLKSALHQPEFKGCRRVVFSLCTSQVITEVVTTPNLPPQRLQKTLMTNVDDYFPVDMTEYHLTWQVIGPKDETGKELLVQLWAVPTGMLTRYYQVANACNLVVERIDYCGNSAAAAVGASFVKPVKPKERKKLSLKTEISFGKKKKEETPTAEPAPAVSRPDTQLYVVLESDLLGITFVQEKQVVLQRFVRCGANPTHQFDELAMMVEYFHSVEVGRGSAVTGFVMGALAENGAMVAELSRTLGIHMQALNSGYESKWALCVGASLGKLEFGIPALNVMKPGRQVESQLWQYILMLVTGLVLVGTVLLLTTSRLSWKTQLSDLKNQQQTLLIQLKKTSGYADTFDKYNSEYNKYSSDWDTVFGNLHTYNDNLVLALEELESTLPEKSSVVGLQIAPDGLTVQFSCSSKEEAAYLIMALRELEYMELVAISNLSGGGGGPVDSYGPQGGEEGEEGGEEGGQEGGTEAPPTEGDYGSLTDQEAKLLAELLASNLDKDELMKVMMGLSEDEMALLESVYGRKPANKYGTLAMLKSAYANKDIFQQRCDALKDMLTTNPFAVRTFVDLVMEDVWSPDPILLWYIYDDLLLPENSDMLDMLMGDGSLNDPVKAYEMMERLLVMLTKNEETLTATEDLICTDVKMERWYVYHLEMALGLQEKTELGFMDMDRILADLMEGSFDTGDKELDKKLNGLVPQEVWDALEAIKEINKPDPGPGPGPGPDPNEKPGPEDYSRAELLGMIYLYTQTGTTNDPYVDNLIKNYLKNGTTGDDRWDEWIKEYERYLKKEDGGELPNPVPDDGKKPEDYQQAELMTMLYKYLNTGSTGDDYLDGLIDNYLMTGTTGDADWDKWLEPYKQYLPGFKDDPSINRPSGNYPYYFTVSLKYKDALKEQEQERKGLSMADKLEKMEVFG